MTKDKVQWTLMHTTMKCKSHHRQWILWPAPTDWMVKRGSQ